LGHTISEYARNVVALGEMELKTAELFEPKASFRLSRSELRATVAGHFERLDAPSTAAHFRKEASILDTGLRRYDEKDFHPPLNPYPEGYASHRGRETNNFPLRSPTV
jgi:hypothetical protein